MITFLDFYEGDTSIHRTACLSLEANVLPARAKTLTFITNVNN